MIKKLVFLSIGKYGLFAKKKDGILKTPIIGEKILASLPRFSYYKHTHEYTNIPVQ